jgi:hypothetical protein
VRPAGTPRRQVRWTGAPQRRTPGPSLRPSRREPPHRNAVQCETSVHPASTDAAEWRLTTTAAPARPIPRIDRRRNPPERNSKQREPGMRAEPTDPADRLRATTAAPARPIPRADRGRKPTERNAIQRKPGVRPEPTDPADRHRATTAAQPRPIPCADRGRKPAESNAIQRGTAATSSRIRPDGRPRLRQSPHATWHGRASGRAPSLASTPPDRGNPRTAPLHPLPMRGTTTTPPTDRG